MRELFGFAAFTVTFVVLLAANVVGVLLLTSVVSVPAWLVIAGWLALWTALGWVVARARGSRPTDWASVCALLGPGGLVWLVAHLGGHMERTAGH